LEKILVQLNQLEGRASFALSRELLRFITTRIRLHQNELFRRPESSVEVDWKPETNELDAHDWILQWKATEETGINNVVVAEASTVFAFRVPRLPRTRKLHDSNKKKPEGSFGEQ
jgi:hypothetical protein